MKHNNLSEFVFCQLEHLLKYRPNAKLLTNDAFLMFSHNKARVWLDNIEETERNSVITGREIDKATV